MTQIANTYANALYDLAKEEGLAEELLQQLEVLQTALDTEPAFYRLLSAPGIPKAERVQVLDNSFRGRVHPYLLNFMKLLTERGYMKSFGACCKVFRSLCNEDHGILQVRAVTATELKEAQRTRLTEKLSALTGKTVQLECKVDSSVLGGVRLDYDGMRIDGTVRNRLDKLSASLKNTVI